jgi:glutamate formiminotransferase/formiminotetrahydrofolate cyclodeaminase
VPESELVHVAVRSLGLDDLTPFDPLQKIIEVRLRKKNLLVDRSIRDFLDELSTDSPAPGGGSVASLMGALSAALAAMVASLTTGKQGYEDAWQAMKEIGLEAQLLKDAYQADIDRDTDAFHELMKAMKMPRTTPAEVTARKDALGRATKGAIEVPLAVLERSVRAAELAREVATKGNRSSLSDAGVAALAARACAEGAFQNVLINLPGIEDHDWAQATMQRARSALSKVRSVADSVAASVEDSLEKALRAPENLALETSRKGSPSR